jgi:hypothetical protein
MTEAGIAGKLFIFQKKIERQDCKDAKKRKNTERRDAEPQRRAGSKPGTPRKAIFLETIPSLSSSASPRLGVHFSFFSWRLGVLAFIPSPP